MKSETYYLISMMWLIGSFFMMEDLLRFIGMMIMSVLFFISYYNATKLELLEKLSELRQKRIDLELETRKTMEENALAMAT